MIRLDRKGLDYLVEVCADIGFAAIGIHTDEDLENAPTVTIAFRQTRIAEVGKPKEPERDPASGQPIDGGEEMLDGTKL